MVTILFLALGTCAILFAFLYFYLLILNGCIRILSTCRSLGIWKRVCIFCFLWIPVLQLFLARYLSKRAHIEFDAGAKRAGSLKR